MSRKNLGDLTLCTTTKDLDPPSPFAKILYISGSEQKNVHKQEKQWVSGLVEVWDTISQRFSVRLTECSGYFFSRAFGARQRLSLTTKIVQIQTIVPVLENIPFKMILVRSSYKIVLFHWSGAAKFRTCIEKNVNLCVFRAPTALCHAFSVRFQSAYGALPCKFSRLRREKSSIF